MKWYFVFQKVINKFKLHDFVLYQVMDIFSANSLLINEFLFIWDWDTLVLRLFINFISDSGMSCSVSNRVNRPLVSKSYFWSIFLIHLTWEEKPLWNILGLGIVFESPFKKKKFSQWNIVGHHAIPIRMLRYWIAHFTCSREQMLIRFI